MRKTCETCCFWVASVRRTDKNGPEYQYGDCNRYPQVLEVPSFYVCGEHSEFEVKTNREQFWENPNCVK